MRGHWTLRVMAVGVGAVLVGCGGSPPAPAPPPPTQAAVQSASQLTFSPGAPAPATARTVAQQTAADVDCGPVAASSGPKLEAVAKATTSGVPGCTEVIDVFTEYFRRAPAESQGTARELTVQGWSCSIADGTTAGCEKDGLSMQAAPAATPTATSTPQPAPQSAPYPQTRANGDVDCGPVTRADGQQVDAVAKAAAAGVPGCTEVIDVFTEYFRRAPAESQGTARELTVQGWACSIADQNAGCTKSGLTMHTAPS